MVLSCKFDPNFGQRLFITVVHNVGLVIRGRAQVLCQVALPAHVEKRVGLGRSSRYLAWEGHNDQSRV